MKFLALGNSKRAGRTSAWPGVACVAAADVTINSLDISFPPKIEIEPDTGGEILLSELPF